MRGERAQMYDYLFKIVLAGDSGVGKTNLVYRFKDNQFMYDSKPTIGVQFESKTLKIQGKTVKCQIWDTAGQDRFKAIASVYYRGAVGALIVYDITRSETFESVERWLKEVQENADQNLVVMLVGNKSDLEEKRVVKTETAEEFAQKNGLLFIETSAALHQNVAEAFDQIIKNIFNKIRVIEPISPPTTDPNINPKSQNGKPEVGKGKMGRNQKEKEFELQPQPKPSKDKKNCCN